MKQRLFPSCSSAVWAARGRTNTFMVVMDTSLAPTEGTHKHVSTSSSEVIKQEHQMEEEKRRRSLFGFMSTTLRLEADEASRP